MSNLSAIFIIITLFISLILPSLRTILCPMASDWLLPRACLS